MLEKLEEVEKRYEELNKLISDPAVISDQNAFKKYMKEQSGLTEVVEKYREYKKVKQNMAEAEEMMTASFGSFLAGTRKEHYLPSGRHTAISP